MKFRLIPPLADFARCIGPRYLVFMGGRGVGKTHALIARIISLTTKFKRFTYLLIVPNLEELGTEIFNGLMDNQIFATKWVKRASAHNGFSILVKNRSRIKIVSSARARIALRGKNINEVAIEECQNPENTLEMFVRLVETMVRGRSPVGNRGTILFLGQFGNKWIEDRLYNFGIPHLEFFDSKGVLLRKLDNPAYFPSMYRAWRVPASEGFIYKQPALYPGEMSGPEDYARRRNDAIQNGDLNAWNQEYECIPTASKYAAFSPELIDEVSEGTEFKLGGDQRFPRPNVIESRPLAGVEYAVIVDPGRTVDPTGVLVGDAFGNVAETDNYPRGQEHERSARNAVELACKYGRGDHPALLVCMATEFRRKGQTEDRYAEIYRRACEQHKPRVPYEALFEGGGAKQEFVDGLTLALQRRKIAIPPKCADLISQLKAYEFRKKKRWNIGGQMEYGAPDGQDSHDDLVSCLYGYVETLNLGNIVSYGRKNFGVGAV